LKSGNDDDRSAERAVTEYSRLTNAKRINDRVNRVIRAKEDEKKKMISVKWHWQLWHARRCGRLAEDKQDLEEM
jgi:hypothetical protein